MRDEEPEIMYEDDVREMIETVREEEEEEEEEEAQQSIICRSNTQLLDISI